MTLEHLPVNNIAAKFRFKAFSIFKADIGMPVSTDGVLLGAWARMFNEGVVLDIGTGTGLLSLMTAQRYPNVTIKAVDIEESAVRAAKFNFQYSNWSSRLSVHEANINHYAEDARNQTAIDSIICNPPYFTSGEQAKDTGRATARHCDTLSHRDLLRSCEQLLKPNKPASFILPKVEGEQFIALAKELGWQVSRLCRVKSTDKKPVSRLLIELTKTSSKIHTEEKDLTIHGSNQGYSEEFVTLTHAFYLKM